MSKRIEIVGTPSKDTLRAAQHIDTMFSMEKPHYKGILLEDELLIVKLGDNGKYPVPTACNSALASVEAVLKTCGYK